MPEIPGPTGRYPEGKQNEFDEGELKVALVVNREQMLVELHFGKSVSWLSVGPDGARQIALAMLRAASELDGKVLEVRTR